jgi:hypothetical protein
MKKIPIFLSLVVVGIMVVGYFLIPHFFGKIDGPGIFGDMFGAINTLFSGFAFIGIIYAIYLQQEQLKTQQEELKLTREEVKSQTKIFAQQTFETTFFQMLKLYRDVINSLGETSTSIYSPGQSPTVTKTEGLYYINKCYNGLAMENEGKDIEKCFTADSENNAIGMSRYFRTVCAILKFIENGKIEDKSTYSEMFKSQFSNIEMTLIFYY